MRASFLWVITWLLFAPPAAAAEPQPGRERALSQLVHADAGVRRAAAVRLGEVGRMSDVPALVKVLRDRDDAARDAAESAIWSVWGRSGDSAIDDLYRRGIAQMSGGGVEEAIATFTRIVRDKPDFAEGWNKRATLYYMAGELDKSLRDCDEVMKRNPLHFGALSGYGLIYAQLGQPERALAYFRRALAINPNMQGVARNIDLLERALAEKRKRYI